MKRTKKKIKISKKKTFKKLDRTYNLKNLKEASLGLLPKFF